MDIPTYLVQAPIGPIGSPIVAAVAVGAIVACIVFERGRVRGATLRWAGMFAAFAAFFGVWGALGLVDVGIALFVLLEAMFAAAGTLVLQRERLAARLAADGATGENRGWSWNMPARRRRMPGLGIRDAMLLALAAFFALLAVEVPGNPNWMWLPTRLFLVAYLMVLAAMAALYFLGQRRATLATIVTAVAIAFGAVQYFLDVFRDTAFQPTDLLAWGTAAAVSGGYTFTVGEPLAWTCICGAASLLALGFIAAPAGPKEKPRSGRRIAVNLLCFALLGGGVSGFAAFVDFHDALGIDLYYWDLRYSYRADTFTLGFITAAQDLRVQAPDGYDEEEARQLEAELAAGYDAQADETRTQAQAQFSQEQPNIIAIMDESYADLSIYEQLHSGYAGTYVTRDLEGARESGGLRVSVFGAGTCNTEFEFLTGGSLAYLGAGIYPFQQFDLENVPALPRQLAALGYHTTGIHASYADNWRRNVVYPQLGFDQCIFYYDATWDASFHRTVSDGATFDKALEVLEEDEGPSFVFDVTIQNHGGYATGSIPESQAVHIDPDFGTADEVAQWEEYLGCIGGSDRDLEALLDKLRDFDEPTVVVFFGDHQPSVARSINDYVFPGEDDAAHTERLMQTPYFIWANYDLAGMAESAGTSANYLAAQLMEAVGAPLSDYQKAQLYLRRSLPAVSAAGHLDATGAWHAADGDEGSGASAQELESPAIPGTGTSEVDEAGNVLADEAASDAEEASGELGTLHYLEVASKL